MFGVKDIVPHIHMNSWPLKRGFTKNCKQMCVDERQRLKPYKEKKYHCEWEK